MQSGPSSLTGTNTINNDFAEKPAAMYGLHPLGANSTRVLKILPLPSTGPLDIISCRLSVIELAEKSAYRAVSYVWGDPSETKLILVDDTPFRVRINLWNFLAQMRAEEYWDALWMDAVCINQHDLKERGEQVAIMGQIYSEAADVRVWLGTGNERCVLAMLRLAEIDWTAVRQAVSRDDMFLYRQPFATDEWFALICELFRLEYWSRLWVIQEYCLAARLAVQYGSMLITATTLEGVRTSIAHTKKYFFGAEGRPACASSISNIHQSPASDIIQARAVIGREPNEEYYASHLSKFRDSQCTDLHDHVYGLLSLGGSSFKKIVPDYTKPLPELFLDIAAQFRENCIDGKAARDCYFALNTLCKKLQLSRKRAEVKEVLEYFHSLAIAEFSE